MQPDKKFEIHFLRKGVCGNSIKSFVYVLGVMGKVDPGSFLDCSLSIMIFFLFTLGEKVLISTMYYIFRLGKPLLYRSRAVS